MGELIDRKAVAEMLRKLADRIETTTSIRIVRIDHRRYDTIPDEALHIEWKRA